MALRMSAEVLKLSGAAFRLSPAIGGLFVYVGNEIENTLFLLL